jgi:hypothetical protein
MKAGIAVLLVVAGCGFNRGQAAFDAPDDDDGGPPDGPRPDAEPDPPDADPNAPDGDPGQPGRKKRFEVANAVSGALDDFPVLIARTDADLAARAEPSGSDIHFRTPLGTPLDHELVSFDVATGELVAWVRLGSMATGTAFYMWYGDPSMTVAENPAGVWTPSGFTTVLHLDENGGGTHANATGGDGAMSSGTETPASTTAGQIARARIFDGDDDVLRFTNPLSGNGPHTFSVWVNLGPATTNQTLIVVGTDIDHESRFLHARFSNQDSVMIGFWSSDWSSGLAIAGTWHLVHWTYTGGSARESYVYRDGQAAGPYVAEAGIMTTGTNGTIGNSTFRWGITNAIDAVLDEVRIATVVRTPAWIAAELANQASPGAFFSVGLEEIP